MLGVSLVGIYSRGHQAFCFKVSLMCQFICFYLQSSSFFSVLRGSVQVHDVKKKKWNVSSSRQELDPSQQSLFCFSLTSSLLLWQILLIANEEVLSLSKPSGGFSSPYWTKLSKSIKTWSGLVLLAFITLPLIASSHSWPSVEKLL